MTEMESTNRSINQSINQLECGLVKRFRVVPAALQFYIIISRNKLTGVNQLKVFDGWLKHASEEVQRVRPST